MVPAVAARPLERALFIMNGPKAYVGGPDLLAFNAVKSNRVGPYLDLSKWGSHPSGVGPYALLGVRSNTLLCQ